eukprot:s577_g7.t3
MRWGKEVFGLPSEIDFWYGAHVPPKFSVDKKMIYAVNFRDIADKSGQSYMRLLPFADLQALNPQLMAPPAPHETWADRARAAPAASNLKKQWEFREARRSLLRYLTQLTLEGLSESEAAPGGYVWPNLGDEGKIPGFFENLNQQLRMFAAPMLDDARASMQQSLQTMPMSSYWKVHMIARGLNTADREHLARGLPDGRLDDKCRYFRVGAMEGESRNPKNSWLPFSTVLLVQCEVPRDKKALPSVPHRFGVQVLDWGKDACPICASDFYLDRRSAVSCYCGGLKVHSCCARYAARQSPLDAALTCQLCDEMVDEPRTDCADHRTWAMFVMDSVMAPLRQGDRKKLLEIEEECFIEDEHAIADRLDDAQKGQPKKQRRPGPLFVPSFVDVVTVAVEGGSQVAGYCAWCCEPTAGAETCIHIMNLAVAQQFRRLGFAKALLQHVESRALEKFPCSLHVRLLVREDNLPANQMYASLGFQEIDRIPEYYGPVPALELQRPLETSVVRGGGGGRRGRG